jgi:hypothetical protein
VPAGYEKSALFIGNISLKPTGGLRADSFVQSLFAQDKPQIASKCSEEQIWIRHQMTDSYFMLTAGYKFTEQM